MKSEKKNETNRSRTDSDQILFDEDGWKQWQRQRASGITATDCVVHHGFPNEINLCQRLYFYT